MSPDSAAQLAAGLEMDHRYGAVADSCVTGKPFGNAVLSRWPIGESTTIPLPGTAPIQPQPRCAVHATVVVDGQPVEAISVHLETAFMRRSGRTGQARTLVHHRLANRSTPTVIGGDFNSASTGAVGALDRAMTNAGLSRATDASVSTFTRFGLPFTLDHLYARGAHGLAAAATASGVITAAEASDHLPIWTRIQIAN